MTFIKRPFLIGKGFFAVKRKYYFNSVIVDKLPDTETLKKRNFVIVIYNDQSYWSVFICPCGCNSVISLPLKKNNGPHWKLELSSKGVPTLSPSVWQKKGCYSHFQIIKGQIKWCTNTGIEPWLIETHIYKKRNKK